MMEPKAMMHLVTESHGEHVCKAPKTQPAGASLAGRVLAILVRFMMNSRINQSAERKRMRIVETLSVGPRKQLVLVSCGGEHFLVGTGPESVHTITRVRPEMEARLPRPIATGDEAR
jgi:hypothetical protein